eukprot:TRINITY_DN25839_c0_g1_i1.p1 TRINITY_DN25839_c0_g1~~TRINITY_DN25839_c0_g1_i1.p1  ORF type:complete len:302 (+),score=48.07 TRINITY_DN25839_c0_g1_i1:204-1109(+)
MHPPNSLLELPGDQTVWYKQPSYRNKKGHSRLWKKKKLRVDENTLHVVGGNEGKIPLKKVIRVGRVALEEDESLCFETSKGVFEYRYGTIGWFLESSSQRWSFACPDDECCQRWLSWVQKNVSHTGISKTDKAAMGIVTSNLIRRAADVLNETDDQSDASAPPISNPSPSDTPRGQNDSPRTHIRTLSAPLTPSEQSTETPRGSVISFTPSRGGYGSYSQGFGRGRIRSNFTHVDSHIPLAAFSSPRGRGIPFNRTHSDDNSSSYSVPFTHYARDRLDSMPYTASVSGMHDALEESVVTVM